MPPASEEVWRCRQKHREYAVDHVQTSLNYHRYLWTVEHVLNDPELAGLNIEIPDSAPDPFDTSVSKRDWEKSVQKYRDKLEKYAKSVQKSTFLKQIIDEKTPGWESCYEEKKAAVGAKFGKCFGTQVRAERHSSINASEAAVW